MSTADLRMQIIDILVNRDGLDREEAEALFGRCQTMVAEGEDPEVVLFEELGLEPDYMEALMP